MLYSVFKTFVIMECKVMELLCKVLFWFFDVFCWMLFEKHLGRKLMFMDH